MDALLWDARQWSYIESFATLARSDLEATIVEQAKQLDGIKKALTQDYNFPGLPISYSISELVAGYKDRNQSSATFMAELNAAEKVIAAQAKQLEEMAEAIRVKDEALAAIATEPGCGCSFPCRCDNPTGNRIEIEARMDIASEALAILPSPDLLDERDQRVAEACAKLLEGGNFLSQESRVALAANGAAKAIRSGKWREYQ